jgi:hypothetical protein
MNGTGTTKEIVPNHSHGVYMSFFAVCGRIAQRNGERNGLVKLKGR